MFSLFFNSIINSYAQVFFSKSKAFAGLVLLVTLIDIRAGFSALYTLLLAQSIVWLTGLRDEHFEEGLFGLNHILVGLCLAQFFSFDLEYLTLLSIASLLSSLISVWLVKWFSRQSLPFLSVPFLITVWIVLLAVRNYQQIQTDESVIYSYNQLYSVGGQELINWMDWGNQLALPIHFEVYFRSLGAIFFQHNLIAGILLATGLFFYSRISFLLSISGFLGGFYYSQFLGEPINVILYSNLGFNFILSAIGLGGFFIIPSYKSFLLALGLTPLIGLLNSSFTVLFEPIGLPVYSLPFNLIVLLVLSVLGQQEKERHLIRTKLQLYLPEKNLYAYINYQRRRDLSESTSFSLPFIGEWRVSQGNDGAYTHQLDWRYALDFDQVDAHGNAARYPGLLAEEYWAHGRPILAPCDGEVVQVIDHIPDNRIGEINQKQNWGNTVLIRHQDNPDLFCQLSHLKEGSVAVQEGQWVRQGGMIGLLGNSGRSPVPHLHFQVQHSPYVGGKSIPYPLTHYLVRHTNRFELVSKGTPSEFDQVSRIEPDELLNQSFSFVPGEKINIEWTQNNEVTTTTWLVITDLKYNVNYLYCEASKSAAYFTCDDGIITFLDYYGPLDSHLYYFYLGAIKIVLGAYPGLEINEDIPLHHILHLHQRFFHDLIAPFHLLYSARYQGKMEAVRLENGQLIEAQIKASVSTHFLTWERSELFINIICRQNRMQSIAIEGSGIKIVGKCL